MLELLLCSKSCVKMFKNKILVLRNYLSELLIPVELGSIAISLINSSKELNRGGKKKTHKNEIKIVAIIVAIDSKYEKKFSHPI